MKKPSKLEMTRRYARLVDLLGLHPESEAITMAAKAFRVKAHQIRTYYLPKARKLIEVDIGMSRREMVNQHHQRLNHIYNTRPGDRLAALSQIAALWGLNAPSQVAVTVDVLYNPEDQLRAMADPRMLQKVLALDAEFEEMRIRKMRSEHAEDCDCEECDEAKGVIDYGNGDGDGRGDAGELPDGEDADTGPPGFLSDP